jgi:cellulose biosynthesis protein BcsQ
MVEKVNTITVYSTRGGSGKTLTALMLGIAATERGLKTLIIDVDLEAPSFTHLFKPDDIYKSWVDYIEEEVEDVLNLPQPTFLPNLSVIYSPPPKVGKAFLGWKSSEWWQKALRLTLIAEKELQANGYDLIIFDNQSGTSLNSINNLVVADASLMVMRPSSYGLGAAEDIVKNIYFSLHGMKERNDYYIWNQVHDPVNDEERTILDNFMTRWDNNLKQYGLSNVGSVRFHSQFNLELLSDKPDFLGVYKRISDIYKEILANIIGSK